MQRTTERDLALASPYDGRQRAELCKAATEATNWRRCSGGLARGEVNAGVRLRVQKWRMRLTNSMAG